MAWRSVLPQTVVEVPQPITVMRVLGSNSSKRLIRFHATQPALREIREKGFGIIGEKTQSGSRQSGFCVIIVNQCFDFQHVLDWFIALETPTELEAEAS